MTRVKVCGTTRPADREAAVRAGADAVGVISETTVETPREVSLDRAAALLADVPPLVTGVLVTMPETVEEAVEAVEATEPDAVQIHGALSPAELGALERRVAVDVIGAVDADSEALAATADRVDALLVDSLDEAGGGGTGRTHDWERTAERVAGVDVPVVLAGGLTPGNVAEAIETVDPFAVDVASGVERDGGLKDHDAVERFVAAAGRAP